MRGAAMHREIRISATAVGIPAAPRVVEGSHD